MNTTASLTLSLLIAVGGGVMAQPDAPGGSVAAERARIVAERARLEAGYLAEDAACYQRFAVNSCLEEVNTRRREMAGDLRRQEILLNEEERKRKGADQIRRTEEKTALERRDADIQQQNKAAQDAQSRVNREQARQESKSKAGSAAQSNRESREARIQANQRKKQAQSARQAEEAEATAKFNDRQQAAQEKRAKNTREREQPGKPPAMPLPPRP